MPEIENFQSEFLTFCRSKPADEVYDPGAPRVCALGQFVAGHGYTGGAVGYHTYDLDTGGKIIQGFYPTPIYESIFGGDYTFGALAARIEALQS